MYPHHNFFITRHNILAHNHIVVTLPVIIAKFAPAIKAITYAGIAAFFSKKIIGSFKKDEKKESHSRFSSERGSSSPMPDPEDPDDDSCNEKEFDEKSVNHIFRDAKGHFKKDCKENRKIILDTVNNRKNFLGKDKYGSEWYSSILDTGKQVWAQVRSNKIRNAGINDVPRKFNSVTGFSNL